MDYHPQKLTMELNLVGPVRTHCLLVRRLSCRQFHNRSFIAAMFRQAEPLVVVPTGILPLPPSADPPEVNRVQFSKSPNLQYHPKPTVILLAR